MSLATPPIAILSALAAEQRGLLELLENPQPTDHAGRTFWQGILHGQPVVLALSKIGKVAAATTATALIERFDVARILFTGVAGGLGPGIAVGDVVVASCFVQHDLDVSPLFPRYEVPLYARSVFETEPTLRQALLEAASRALAGLAGDAAMHEYQNARVHYGLIASGDRFVSAPGESAELRRALQAAGHAALAVEMEGAAVAQVCHDYGIPFAAVRTVSDRADNTAHADFAEFVERVASPYTCAIVRAFLAAMPAALR